MAIKETVEAFKSYQKKMHAYEHAMGVLYYDAETAMPKGGNDGLNMTLGALSEESYKLSVSDELKGMIAEILAHTDDVDLQTRREAEELNESLEKMEKIPMQEFVEYQVAQNTASHVWHEAKVNNDYASFEPHLKKLVEYNRRFAGYFDPTKHPYDVWINEFEKGLDRGILDAYFARVRECIVPLVKRISEKPNFDYPFMHMNYPIPTQRLLSDYFMEVMTIDRDYCTIGEVEHPFTTEFNKHDVRITTHYYEDLMVSNMYSVIHEGGHALYELHTGDELMGGVLAGGASMGVHESQSRFFENIIGRSREFIGFVFPRMAELFPEQLKGVTALDFYRAANRAEPSLIRTEADELTYSLHIMVRYEIEKQLIGGELSTRDLPEAWNALYKEYLGVTVPDYKQGVLQDSHWSGGSFGYFPSYSIGSAYSAQMLASMQKDIPVFELAAKGELAPIVAWLTERIYKYGCLKKPAELVQSACGAPFDPTFYTDYLTAKFTDLYSL